MYTVNIHDAKTNLSRLIEQVVLQGEPFIIAKAGKPMVKVIALESQHMKRTGFMKGELRVPDDFDNMGHDEIQAMFGSIDHE